MRSMTSGERALARSIFKEAVLYEAVKVHDGKYVFFQPDNSGMTPNGKIYIHGIYRADYASASPSLQGFFIHEMTHVWQHQIGVLTLGAIGSAILEMVGRGGEYDGAYPYVLDADKDLRDYNLEQQASILEDYFRVTQLGLQPRRARLAYSRTCSPNPRGEPTRQLYEAVLRRFLQDPTYGVRLYRRYCAEPA